jgi:hypothetical protein
MRKLFMPVLATILLATPVLAQSSSDFDVSSSSSTTTTSLSSAPSANSTSNDLADQAQQAASSAEKKIEGTIKANQDPLERIKTKDVQAVAAVRG